MDDTVDYQDDTDARSGPDSIVDDSSHTDMIADIATGLHIVAERTKRSLNCKMKSTKAQSTKGDKRINVQFVLNVDISLFATRRDDECHIANLLLCSCSRKCGAWW